MKTLIISPPNLAINQNAYRQTDCAVAPLGGLFMEYYKNTSLELLTGYDDYGNLHVEEFKDIPDYAGRYQASTFGRIKSFAKFHGIDEIILKPTINKKGYLYTGLTKDKKTKTVKFHIMVAITFIPNHENKPTVNHIDLNKTNCCVWNLEWATERENTVHYHLTTQKTSNYTGVHWHTENKLWIAQIIYLGKRVYLGSFSNELDAANAYQSTLKEINNGTFVPPKKKNRTSPYKGVSFNKGKNKWEANIQYKGRYFYLGSFATELEAHEAYQNKLKELKNI